jgi:hypothetical protein
MDETQWGLQKNIVMFTKKLWEFFCEHNGENFGTNRTIWFPFLTKKRKQGKKSVKIPLTFFLLLNGQKHFATQCTSFFAFC